MGIVLAVIFGALFFYLYTRVLQVEKRMSLTENILLDLKMATENTLLMMSGGGNRERYVNEYEMNDEGEDKHIEAVSEPQPIPEQEIEELKDEDFYKSVLESTVVPTSEGDVGQTKVDVNYESLSKKELHDIVKQRGLSVHKSAGKKEMIDTLKKNNTNQSVVETQPPTVTGSGTETFMMTGAELSE